MSGPREGPPSTDRKEQVPPASLTDSEVPFPRPTSTGRVDQLVNKSGLVINPANSGGVSHSTSTAEHQVPLTANEEFQGTITGPPPQPAFARPARSTRNPHPYYVDGFNLEI